MTHYLAQRGWKLKPRHSAETGIFMGMWWYDLADKPRLHENSFVCRVIEGKEDNLPARKPDGNGKAASDAGAGNGLQR